MGGNQGQGEEVGNAVPMSRRSGGLRGGVGSPPGAGDTVTTQQGDREAEGNMPRPCGREGVSTEKGSVVK